MPKLIRRLQEYERFKQAAEDINELPQLGRDVFPVVVEAPHKHVDQPPPDVDLKEVLLALKDVLHRADMFTSHHVAREPLSLRERMSRVLESVSTRTLHPVHRPVRYQRGSPGGGGHLHGGARTHQAAAYRAGAGRVFRADSRQGAR